MGVEDQQGSYGHNTTNTGAANRAKLKQAGYGGVRFRDTKGEKSERGPNWEDAGLGDGVDTKGEAAVIRPQTAAETTEYRNKSGIAPTAKNMGALAVKFRANEQAKTDAGEQTDTAKRAQKIFDTRLADGRATRGQPSNNALEAFKKRYWSAREVWAGDKGAYSGVTPAGSEASHGGGQRRNSPGSSGHTQSTKKPGSRQSARGLGSAQAPRSGYGLF